jgi:hypothetical protein
MSILGFIKDVVLLPIDIALDLTLITPMIRSVEDTNDDSPFGTVDRLRSMAHNLDGTRKL